LPITPFPRVETAVVQEASIENSAARVARPVVSR
jgi:hypothetical protein